MIGVWIEPHERHEAVEAYRDRLSVAQVEAIEDAPGIRSGFETLR